MQNVLRILRRTGAQICAWSVISTLAIGCARHHSEQDAAVQYQTDRITEYHEHYHNPLLSPGAQFATLPPAVQRTVRAEAGAAEITDVIKDNLYGRVLYRIYFRDRGIDPPLYVAPDGTLLNPDLTVAIGAAKDTVGVLTGGPVTGITLGDLPPQVVKTIQTRVPDAEVSYLNKETRGDQVIYLVVFKDQMHPSLKIAADGSLVSPEAVGHK